MDATPKIEAARVAALNRYAILDTEPEQTFDDLVTLASYVCKTPMAFLSLVDDHRQWFKSKVGVEVRETPLEASDLRARNPGREGRSFYCAQTRCWIRGFAKIRWWCMSREYVFMPEHR